METISLGGKERRTMKPSKNYSFVRRIQGLKKKTYELATLCGVDSLLICYDDSGSDQQAISQTWPEKPDEVRRIIKCYQDHLLQENTCRRRRQHPFAVEMQKKKRRKIVDVQEEDDSILNGFTSDQLQELLKAVDSKLEEVNELLTEKRDQKFHQRLPSSETELMITSFAGAPNQDCISRSDDYIDLCHCKPLSQRIDLGPALPMSCLCDSTRFVLDPLLPKLHKEKQDQWNLSSSDIETMIRYVKGLENGDCSSTMLGCCAPLPSMIGLDPPISLPSPSDSMGFFHDPSLQYLQKEKLDQRSLSNSDIEALIGYFGGAENPSQATSPMIEVGPSISMPCSSDSMLFFHNPSILANSTRSGVGIWDYTEPCSSMSTHLMSSYGMLRPRQQ